MNIYRLFSKRIIATLLTCLLSSAAQADAGPALSSITARAGNASTVFWSPAGITRLDQPELITQATLVAMESKFNAEESNINGGNANYDPLNRHSGQSVANACRDAGGRTMHGAIAETRTKARSALNA